jgi:hypothetical protein
MLFADIDPPGALTTRGNVTVQGTASIDGGNQVPPGGWGPYCTTVPTDDGAGVVTDAGGTVETTGTGSVDGDPPTVQDPTIVDETFTNFGNLSWTDLTTLAQIEGKVISHISTLNNTFPQLDGGGACDEVPVDNWGDPQVPTNPCGAYFPLIYHGGNLTIQSNGYGQGILLIEGDLDLRGGYHFYGIIITQGAFATGAGGATVYGAVLAGNDLILDQTATGGAQIIYSRCAVRRAVLNNANLSRARPLATRSWVDLSAVTN